MQLLLLAHLFGGAAALQSRDAPVENLMAQKAHSKVHTSKLLSGTQSIYQELESKVGSVADAIASEEASALEELKSRRIDYQAELDAARHKNSNAHELNGQIELEITKKQQSIKALRDESQTLIEETKQLNAELKTLTDKIALAHEFAAETMNVSSTKLQAEALKVLDELDASDAEEAHKKALHKFIPHVSMLSVTPNTETLLSGLSAHFDEVTSAKKANLAKLEEEYQKQSKVLQLQYNELLQKQEKLNVTLEELVDTEKRVKHAVKHLKDTRLVLSKRVNALRVFGHDLGSEAQPGTAWEQDKKALAAPKSEASAVETLQEVQKTLFQQLSEGSECPSGMEISTVEECKQAVAELRLSDGPTWTKATQKIPHGCSFKVGDCASSHCMHFNTGPGTARSDLMPLCRSAL